MQYLYAFTETLFHSLWQGAAFLLLYLLVSLIVPQTHPLRRRNFLYSLLAFQLSASVITFIAVYGTSLPYTTAHLFTATLKAELLQRFALPLFSAYVIAVCFRSVFIARKHYFFKTTAQKLIRPTAELRVFTELKAIHLGINKKVSLWFTTNFSVPMTYGFFRPVILLPVSMLNNLSMQEIEAIILHELVHIRHADYLLNKFLIAVETVFLFNPFIRIIAKKIRLEREKNCDVQVIDFRYPTWQYADALLKLARFRADNNAFSLGAFGRRSELVQRIQYFSKVQNSVFRKHNIAFSSARVLCASLVIICFYLAPPIAGRTVSLSSVISTPKIISSSETVPEETSRIETVAPLVRENELPSLPGSPEFTAAENFPTDISSDEPDLFSMPVSFAPEEDSVKELIYDVETPKGIVRQSFRMRLVKGEWIIEPLWMTIETRPAPAFADSLLFSLPADTLQ